MFDHDNDNDNANANDSNKNDRIDDDYGEHCDENDHNNNYERFMTFTVRSTSHSIMCVSLLDTITILFFTGKY